MEVNLTCYEDEMSELKMTKKKKDHLYALTMSFIVYLYVHVCLQ